MASGVGMKTIKTIQKTIDALSGKAVRGRVVPTYLPDGSDVTSVGQVAAMLGVGAKVAALYVLETKELAHVHAEAKALFPPPQSDKSGIAIMLYTTLEASRQIAIDGGTSPDDIHITLGYFGKTGSDTAPTEMELMALCRALAMTKEPFSVLLNGVTRFTAPPDERDPFVVNVDSVDVEDLRRTLVMMCEDHDFDLIRNHGYTPHITLGYLDDEGMPPLSKWTSIEVKIPWIVLGYGENYSVFPLGVEGKDVHSAALGSPVSSLRTDAYVVERFSGRVRRVKNRTQKKKRED